MSDATQAALIQYALVPAAGLLIALLARLLHKAGSLAHERAASEAQGSAHAREFAALEVLANCAADAVAHIESAERPKLKAATADGKISAEEGAQLKADAMAMAEEAARAAAPKILAAAGLDDIGAILGHMIDGAAARLAGSSRDALAAASAASPAAPGPSAPPTP